MNIFFSRYKLLALFLTVIFISACISVTPVDLAPIPTSTERPDVETSDWIDIYFTEPDNPNSNNYRGGPDAALAAAIDEARFSIDAAIYHLNLWSIRDALIAAHARGVTVRVVTESNNLDEAEMQDLIEAGIPVIGDRRESLMHNKFVVIDGHEVWTGSMNFTVNGAYKNDNHLLRVRSSRLAENYISEFNEMFNNDFFGDYVLKNTLHSTITIDGSAIETYFSPDDGTAAQIINQIRSAEKSVFFMAFSFTSDDIASALIAKAADGVQVAGIFEEGQYHSNRGTEFDNLVNAGLDIHLDGNNRNMHHKAFIIDEEIVIVGSYNFSRSAEERNDENTLVIYNADVAELFLEEFERVFEQAVKD